MSKLFIRNDVLKNVENLIRIFGSNKNKPPENWQEKLKRDYPVFEKTKDNDLHYIRNTFISSLTNHNISNNYERALSGFKKSLDKAKHNREMTIDNRNSNDNKYISYDGESKNDFKKFLKNIERYKILKTVEVMKNIETIDDIFPL